MEPAAKVVLAIPAGRHMAPPVVNRLLDLFVHGASLGLVVAKILISDTYLDTGRNMLVTYAMDVPGCTHIMWIDSDNTPPVDTVERLLAHDKPVVGGLYHQRAFPHYPVAYGPNPDDPAKATIELIKDLPRDPHGLLPVHGLGMGCTLTRLDIFTEMADFYGDPRWFQVNNPPGVGEDIFFFHRLWHMWEVQGHPVPSGVWLDCDVRTGHVRDEEVTTAHWAAALDQIGSERVDGSRWIHAAP